MEMPTQGGSVAQGGEASAVVGLESPLSPPLSPATAAAAALANARWNPSKEQVAVLEGLYEHGLRTPSAEQIQHIAGRLREHGPVEAKNVFYWFQNHKARQRQKQKQDGFAYFTRLLRRPPPLPLIRPPHPLGRRSMPASPPVMSLAPPPAPAPCNNIGSVHHAAGGTHHVMYRAPYFMPAPPSQASSVANAPGFYNLQQQAAHHMAFMYPRLEIPQDKQQMNLTNMYQQATSYSTMSNPLHVATPANGGASANHHVGRTRETLELFPLRPSFLLPDNKTRGASVLASRSTPSASASFSGGESESLTESPKSNAEALPFYDFFGLQSAGR